MAQTFLIDCPKCGIRIEIDAKSGKVLKHYEKPDVKSGDPLKEMMEKMKSEKEKLNDYFKGAKSGMEEKRKELEKQFEENKKKIKESGDDSKPINPMDLD
ncbi:MAG: hypothetical protein GX447_01265 [Elusimicrobia bacterium]|nr:hypothetical protein [Elusimicrobiota bacterium]